MKQSCGSWMNQEQSVYYYKCRVSKYIHVLIHMLRSQFCRYLTEDVTRLIYLRGSQIVVMLYYYMYSA